MAVQTHDNPSSLFFLNRNGQEGSAFSPELQKSQFPSITTGVDTRKRAREVSSVTDLDITASPMNPPPHFISRRQTPNVVSTGLRLSQGQWQTREHRSTTLPMITGDIAGEIKRQNDELDVLLQTQGAEMRRMLAENNERHYRELLRTMEESVRRRIKEKEAEVVKATRRYAELEARAAQMETESRAWQVRAAAREKPKRLRYKLDCSKRSRGSHGDGTKIGGKRRRCGRS